MPPRKNPPLLIVAVLSGVLCSMIGGFLIASYTISGITPAYVLPQEPDRRTKRIAPPSDDWREAQYRRIGLWDAPARTRRTPRRVLTGQAAGSSRL